LPHHSPDFSAEQRADMASSDALLSIGRRM
jgi:hypothetical protein